MTAAHDARQASRWWALPVITLAQLMIVLDGTIVNIALPSMQADLGMSDSGPAMGGHRLRPGVRRPAAARRPDQRTVRPPPHVLGQPRRLRGPHRRSAAPRNPPAPCSPPAPSRDVRRRDGPGGAVTAHPDVHRPAGPRQGVRRSSVR
ncbi:hypothetical protein ACU686_43320 [Yinghuangia aomiensis]